MGSGTRVLSNPYVQFCVKGFGGGRFGERRTDGRARRRSRGARRHDVPLDVLERRVLLSTVLYQQNYDGLAPGQLGPISVAGQDGYFDASAAFPATYSTIQSGTANIGQALLQVSPASAGSGTQTIADRLLAPALLSASPVVTLSADFFSSSSNLAFKNSYTAILKAAQSGAAGGGVLSFTLGGGNGTAKSTTGVNVGLSKFNGTNSNVAVALAIGQQLSWNAWHHVSLTVDYATQQYVSLTVDGQTASLAGVPLPRSFSGGVPYLPTQLDMIDQEIIANTLSGQATTDNVVWDNVQLSVNADGASVASVGVLPGDVSSVATATNASGQVVGYSQDANGVKHAFLYSNGVLTSLGVLPGDVASAATAINAGGTVVGYSENANGTRRSFKYANGVMTDLNALSGSDGRIVIPNGNAAAPLAEYSMTAGTLSTAVSLGVSGGRMIAASGSALFVANGSVISVYGTNGALANASLISGLNHIDDIVVSGSDLYVGDSGNQANTFRIGRYTLAGAAVNATLLVDSSGTLRHLAVSGTDIFVSINGEDGQERIAKYSTSGSMINPSLITGIHFSTGLVAVGSLLFVSDGDNDRISEYTSTGMVVNANLITNLAGLQGIAVSDGYIYVTNAGDGDHKNGSIAKYTVAGAVVTKLLVSQLLGPFDLAVAGSVLFETCDTDKIVHAFTTAGAPLPFQLVPGIVSPTAVAVSGPSMYVANGGTNTVGLYTRSGATVNTSLITGLSSPSALAISGPELFIANRGSKTIGAYTLAGQTVNTSLITGLADPVGIATAGSLIFVVNQSTGTVGEYTVYGATINASLITGLNSPTAIAVADGRLYITNSGNGTVAVYSLTGGLLNASLIAGLQSPSAIAVSGRDLFVANKTSGTIGEYTVTGGVLNAAFISGLTAPTAIAVAVGVSQAMDINDGGQIVGYSQRADGSSYAYLSNGGSLTTVPALAGAVSSFANALNNGGEIVGYSQMADGSAAAFAYSNGFLTNLGSLPGSYFTIPTAINNSGEIVGYWQGVDAVGHGFRYNGVSLYDLGVLAGDVRSVATGVNGSGEIVGYSENARGSTEAFLYQNGSLQSLGQILIANTSATIGSYGPLGAPVNPALITGLNVSSGIVVSGTNVLVTSKNSGETSIGTIGEYTQAGGIVDQGVVVGLTRPTTFAFSDSYFYINIYDGSSDFYVRKYTSTGDLVPGFPLFGLHVANNSSIAVVGSSVFFERLGQIQQYSTSGVLINPNVLPAVSAGTSFAISGSTIFVNNATTGAIGKYTLSGATVNAALIPGVGGLLTVQNGILFVLNAGTGVVAEYTLSGVPINTSVITGLSNPTAIAAAGAFLPLGLGINDAGQIVGQGYDSSGRLSAQVYTPVPLNPAPVLVNVSGSENAGVVDRSALPATVPYSSAGAVGPTGTYKWTQPGGLAHPVYISYSVANLLDGNLGGSLSANQIVAAAEQAMGLWSSVAPLVFVEVPDAGPDPTIIGSGFYPSAFNPMIRFGQRNIQTDIALTTQPYSATNGQSGDVNLNTSTYWTLDPAQGFDLREVFLHEIGLALGLYEDTAHPASIMSGYTGRFPVGTAPTLNPLDVVNIQGIYGSGAGGVYPLFMPAIALPIAQATGLSGLPVTELTLFDVPAGTTFSAGTDQGNGTWTFAAYEISGLMLAPPRNYHGKFVLPVVARTSDGAVHQGNVAVNIAAVAYAPNLVVAGPAQGDAATPIYLPIEASLVVPTDSDAVLSVVVSGVPANATVSGGTFVSPGVWSLNPANVNGFSITPALGSASFTLQVTAKDTQISNGATASTTLPLSVIVVPVVGDSYESADNTVTKATYLPLHVLQNHSIFPAGDVDWYTINVLRDNSEVDLFARSPNDASAPLVSNLTLTLYSDAAGTIQIGQANGELAKVVPAGQYYLRVTHPLAGGVANYTIQLGITDPSATAPILVGTASLTDPALDHFDDPANYPLSPPNGTSPTANTYGDNRSSSGVPLLVAGNQYNPSNAATYPRAIYAPTDVDWTTFTLASRSVVTLLAFNPFATVANGGIVGNHPAVPAILCVFNASSSQVTNFFDANSAFPSVQSKFSATLAPGTYYVVAYAATGTPPLNPVPSYDLNLAITPAPDSTAPTATISLAPGQPNPTLASNVAFVAQFNKPVTGLTGAGIVLPAGTSVSVQPVNPVGGYASTFNILATGITSAMAVNIGISANAARDASGNFNAALPAGVPTVYVGQSAFVGAKLFYKGSAYDTGGHDNAIAPDKTPLLPGQTATFANYTSYVRGINGVMLDIATLPATLAASDFVFRVGNDATPGTWAPAPAPASITTRPGAGANASTRIEITWADNAIQNAWLQVTIKGGAGSTSALATDTTFYFGNAIGETGDAPGNANVNSFDELGARYFAANLSAQNNATALANVYDFNRDKLVNATDESLAGQNYTNIFTGLKLLTVPAAPQAIAATMPPLDTTTDEPPSPPVPSPVPVSPAPLPVQPLPPVASPTPVPRKKPILSHTRPLPRFHNGMKRFGFALFSGK